MLNFSIPGHEPFSIKKVVLDLNGTVSNHGKTVEGVAERIEQLRAKALQLFLFSGDTQGTAALIAKELDLEFRLTPNAKAKADEAIKLGADTAATIGNGAIDAELFQVCKLRLGVIQAEGFNPILFQYCDAVYTSVNDALDALLMPKGLIATMRK